MGDDWFDMPLLQRVGLSACPADAQPCVREIVLHVCQHAGGNGAVRELGDMLLSARRAANIIQGEV